MSYFRTLFDRIEDLVFHRPDPDPPAPTQSIAEIAATNGNFDILVAALDAAGLTQTFVDPGDYTVFAPTDAAFIELASTTLGLDVDGKSETEVAVELVNTLGVDTLKNVLFFHAKAGSSTVSDLQSAGTVSTLLPGTSFDVDGNELIDADPEVEDPEFIDGLTDIRATNGIIQVIDRVLLPIDVAEATAQPTIADVASGNENFEALTAALVATGLVGLFQDRDNDFTVFAPTDDAFRTLATELGLDVSGVSDADLAGALVGALGAELVTNVLLYHVKAGGSTVAELQDARVVETALDGATFGVVGGELIDKDPQIENPNFIDGLTDIETANGEIQAIDRVLLPIDVEPVGNLYLRGKWFKDDYLQGGAGHDVIVGLAGDDILNGGEGGDKVFGGWGHDHLLGDGGNDRLFGGWGDDHLFGGGGNDALRGGAGNDHLAGGSGNNYLVGGFGSDRFDFSELSGVDTVRDFRWNDVLIVSTEDFADFDAVSDAARSVGNHTIIDAEDGAIRLLGVRHIEEDDFIFV